MRKTDEGPSMYTVTIALENDPDNHFLGFMNTTSWEPLKGTTTLLSVRDAIANGSSYAPVGGSLRDEQFMITEDSIQTVDLVIVRILLSVLYERCSLVLSDSVTRL